MTSHILVTPRSLTAPGLDNVAALQPLRDAGYTLVPCTPGKAPDQDELLTLVPGVVGWLAGVERISAQVLGAADSLRVISRNGAGSDGIDKAAAAARGIAVQTAPGANTRGVAELTLGLMFSTLRGLTEANEAMRAGQWTRVLGKEFPDISVGLVGYGAVGRLVASMTVDLGARVVAYDPYARPAPPVEAIDSLDDLCAQSDVISVHAPGPADGSPLMTREVLSHTKPGTILINTARSAVVDDNAVLDALASEHLSWYAVDAFDTEPPEPTPLLRHPRTLMTPHLGGYTDASTRRATVAAVTHLLNTLET